MKLSGQYISASKAMPENRVYRYFKEQIEFALDRAKPHTVDNQMFPEDTTALLKNEFLLP